MSSKNESQRKQYCLRGHDTHVTGRDLISYHCIACRREKAKARRRQDKLSPTADNKG